MKQLVMLTFAVFMLLMCSAFNCYAQEEYLEDIAGNSLVGPYYMHGCEKQLPVVTHYCGAGKGIAPITDDSYIFRFQHGEPYLLLAIKPGSGMAVDPSKSMRLPAMCAEGTSICGSFHTPTPTPTPSPTPSPTPTPSSTPTPSPTAMSTPAPTAMPTPESTPKPDKRIIVHHRFIN